MRSKIFLLLFSILTCIPLAHSGPRFIYCNNERDYKVHMEFHRMRVAMLAVYIFYTDPSKFLGVDEHTLVEYIATEHDDSKLDLSSLIAKRLMHFYGTAYDKRDEQNKEELRSLVAYINKTDEKRRVKFFKRKMITSQRVIDAYVMLETIGDLLDRSYDPVAKEEFGREMYPASESPKLSKDVLPVVLDFEMTGKTKYQSIIKGFEFPIDTTGLADCFVFMSKARMKMRLETIKFQLGYN